MVLPDPQAQEAAAGGCGSGPLPIPGGMAITNGSLVTHHRERGPAGPGPSAAGNLRVRPASAQMLPMGNKVTVVQARQPHA